MSEEIGALTADLFRAKNIKAEHNAEIKILNAEIEEIEKQLLIAMEKQNLLACNSIYGSVYIARQTTPKVINWDALYEYILENRAFYLLERRVLKTAFQELHEQGQALPGVDPVVFNEVRTRKS